MSIKNLSITLLVLLVLLSCEEQTETIRGRVVFYETAQTTERMAGQPVVGLPVSIYYQRDPSEELDISQQKLFAVSYTDSDGYYHFTTKEFDNHELERFNAYALKSGPFDSTLVEWHYVKDSTFYRHLDLWFEEDETADQTNYYRPKFSDLKKHVYDPLANGFYLLPSGWVVFDLKNLTGAELITNTNNAYCAFLHIRFVNTSNPNAYYFLTPHQKHSFRISRNSSGEEDYFLIEDIYIHNSYDPDSRPGHERLVPDTIRVDLNTMEYWHIRAKF